MEKFLANSTIDTEKPIESDDDKSNHDEITEEQFLNEQNAMFKDDLLQDSSESEMNSDSDERLNGRFILSNLLFFILLDQSNVNSTFSSFSFRKRHLFRFG